MLTHFLQKWRSPSTAIPYLSIACLCMSAAVLAETTMVDAKASGKFGAFEMNVDQRSLDLVEIHVFTVPGKITIRVDGIIDLHPTYRAAMGIDAGGLSSRRSTTGTYTPLDEATVDVNGHDALPRIMENNGVLFGAFVPESKVNTPGFRPINEDFPDGGISSDSLFLIGSGLDFTANEPGTLFVGVNDSRPGNNSGSFSVTVSVH